MVYSSSWYVLDLERCYGHRYIYNIGDATNLTVTKVRLDHGGQILLTSKVFTAHVIANSSSVPPPALKLFRNSDLPISTMGPVILVFLLLSVQLNTASNLGGNVSSMKTSLGLQVLLVACPLAAPRHYFSDKLFASCNEIKWQFIIFGLFIHWINILSGFTDNFLINVLSTQLVSFGARPE